MNVGAISLALAITIGSMPGTACAAAGRLTCTFGTGAGIGVGAYRDAACTFDRPGRASERYEGYTGIIAAPAGRVETIIFSVDLPRQEALAALGGDYAGRGFGSSGASAALVNDADGSIILRPTDNSAATSLAPLNSVLGVSQLHLNYAGRVRPAR